MPTKKEFRLTVDIPTELKLRVDIHSKIEGTPIKEIVIEALKSYVPEYYVNLK